MNDENVWIAFMACIEHKHREDVMNYLKSYDIGYYIVSFETSKSSHAETNGEHMHFVVQMSEKDYHTLTIRVFKNKYNLRGRAVDGKPRQYGKVKEIENLEKMKAYTLKEGDYETNIPDEEIEMLYSMSKSKNEEADKEDELMQYLADVPMKYHENHGVNTMAGYHRLCKAVVKFYIENNKSRKGLTKAGVQGIVRKFIMYHYTGPVELKTEWIYDILFEY
uniref:hypothetical protein n=2 Tax=Pseudomonadati TaxID=3379134 RepID=UPI00404AA907